MNLEQNISHYQTTETAKSLLHSTKIVLLVGIAGAGKDTIKKQLLKSGDFYDIVSHTTRLPRTNNGLIEKNGVDYHFVDIPTIETMVADQAFIEVKFVHGTVYGTSIGEVQHAHDEHKIATTDIDVQGVDEYKRLADETVAIFILPPDYATWRQRLETRYETHEEFEAEWPKRFESAVKELTHALSKPYYHFIINDNLDETVRLVKEISMRPDLYNRKDDEARLAARDLLEQLESTASN